MGSLYLFFVWEHINLTSPLRNESNGHALFVGASSPHSEVSNSTIGRWIKSCLVSAEIDTNIYSAHSTRGSEASKEFANGVSVSSILLNFLWSWLFQIFFRSVVAVGITRGTTSLVLIMSIIMIILLAELSAARVWRLRGTPLPRKLQNVFTK